MNTRFSIASWSFNRLLKVGKQDMFKYIEVSKDLGMAQLDPWNGHLAPIVTEDLHLKEHDPGAAAFSAETQQYVQDVKVKANDLGLPFGCLAVDGPHIFWDTLEERRVNRLAAYRWLNVAHELGASQVRVDAGGPEDMPDDIFGIIVKGYQDLIQRAGDLGIELLIENHWGPSKHPLNLVKILEAVDGLGLLFDSDNFVAEVRETAWEQFAPVARAVHIKTFEFDEAGNEKSVDLAQVINLLVKAGYDDVWGIESCPHDGDEYNGVKMTKALIERILSE